MHLFVRLSSSLVSDVTTPVSGLINDLDKAMRTKSSQSLLGL